MTINIFLWLGLIDLLSRTLTFQLNILEKSEENPLISFSLKLSFVLATVFANFLSNYLNFGPV